MSEPGPHMCHEACPVCGGIRLLLSCEFCGTVYATKRGLPLPHCAPIAGEHHA